MGAGNDTYFVDDPNTVVLENPNEGYDTIYASVSYKLAAGSHVEVLATRNNLGTEPLNLTGNELRNLIVGNAGANFIDGGVGADWLDGRGGNDSYIVDQAGDLVIEAAGGGYDAVYAAASFTLNPGAEVEVLGTVDNLATTAINLIGNDYDNLIVGNEGVNILHGGAGRDYLDGRGGDDSYIVDDLGDIVLEGAGRGNDIVYASVDFALRPGEEVETLATANNLAANAINLIGNELNNVISGNAGANILDGGGGRDYLDGRGGDDSYVVDSADDTVLEAAGGGNDAVYASVSYALAAGQEVETLATANNLATTALSLTGNAFGNLIIGNAGANSLTGGGGRDYFDGRGGGDSYFVDSADDVVFEAFGGGNDAVYASVNYALAAGQEVETLATVDNLATSAIDLTGNEHGNMLSGNEGANTLDGGLGADYLDGRGGSDTYAFSTGVGFATIDTVMSFVSGVDRIRLGGEAGQPFAALASGALAAGALVIGPAALQPDDVLLYNAGTGALSYDADGSGAGSANIFAWLPTGLALTAADFTVSGPLNGKPVISSPATASIAENSPATTIVYQTAASDPDGDRIVYSLAGDDAALFSIDQTGAVRLLAGADYETRASYSIVVVASDSGTDPASRGVAVSVVDVAEIGTPIVNETGSANDGIGSAQAIARATLAVAPNPNLLNDDLPSATIQGGVSAFGDKDFFSITLAQGELLILDVDGSGGDLDTHVKVYTAGGALLDDNDDPGYIDPGSDPHPEYGHNTDSLVRFRAPSAGTYYFSIEAFNDPDNPTSGSYQLNVSVGPPASVDELLEEDIEALISGSQWNQTALTYSFPSSASHYPPGTTETQGLQQFNATQQAATTQMLQLVSQVTNLTFQLLAPGPANLRFAESDEPGAAFAYYPGSSLGGTAWFNHSDFNTPIKGNYAWMGILHEAGHALGLKHGHESPAISTDRDSLEYSVMTYRSYPGAPVGPGDGGYTNETWGYPQSLMMLDIAALQRIYGGANFNHNATDSVYSWSPATSEMSINGAGQGAAGGNRVFMTVWDGGGTDTYDFSAYGNGVTIDLRPGQWSLTSATQTANLGDGNSARGNIANALLFEDDPRSLIEHAVGGASADTLIANPAANRLTGNAGSDTFKWYSSGDAGTGGSADTILDLVRGSDHIDLSAIDAIPATGANDAFSFIGSGAFTSSAGQLRYQVEGSNVRVQADLDGNGVADLEIVVNGTTILSGPDFFL